jgi:hypothetical protein
MAMIGQTTRALGFARYAHAGLCMSAAELTPIPHRYFCRLAYVHREKRFSASNKSRICNALTIVG